MNFELLQPEESEKTMVLKIDRIFQQHFRRYYFEAGNSLGKEVIEIDLKRGELSCSSINMYFPLFRNYTAARGKDPTFAWFSNQICRRSEYHFECRDLVPFIVDFRYHLWNKFFELYCYCSHSTLAHSNFSNTASSWILFTNFFEVIFSFVERTGEIIYFETLAIHV